MKIVFTSISTTYACAELGRALINAVPLITQVALEYQGKDDDRTLVIVLTCPCCNNDPLLKTENAVLVSPFFGIDPDGYKIHQTDKHPPFRNPGENDEAHDINEYLNALRTTINQALA